MVLPKGNRLSVGPYRTLSITLIGLVVVLLAGPGLAAAAPTSSAMPAAPHAVPVTSAALLHSAVASLSSGAGPAFGNPTQCHAVSSTSANCVATLALDHRSPAISPPEMWQNASPGANYYGAPPASTSASMAWDPTYSSILFFGGCDATACPDNQTWLYNFGTWYNVTNYSDAPPATNGAAMDYDNFFGAIILFGGCSTVCPNNYTYAYFSNSWVNATLFSPQAPPQRSDASMVFVNNTLDNETMLFGGFDAFGFPLGDTWVFNISGWIQIFPGSAPSPRGLAAMAYYPALGDAVLFGGCNLLSCSLNDTWVYSGGSWGNFTPSFPILGYLNPPGRALASMTYDAYDNSLVMFGGLNDTTYLSDTWEFTCPLFCGWANVTVAGSAIPATYDAATPSQSPYDAPILFGGVTEVGGVLQASNSTWVFEPQFTIAPIIVPATGPARGLINASLNGLGGTTPYYGTWSALGSSLYGTNLSFFFAYPGTFQLNVTAYDWYGVLQTATIIAHETGVSAQAQASLTTTDVNVAVAFSTAAATGGTPAYVYNWSWGDGSANGTGLTPSHTYTAVGTYVATLEVTDANGLTNTSSVTIQVVAAPTATFTPSTSTADIGAVVTFTPTVSGGASPYTYSWNFGDHSTVSTATAPTHSYAAAGTYTVFLNVTDAAGVVAPHQATVTVIAALVATVSKTPTVIGTGETVNFTTTVSGGLSPYTYYWVFGDGAHSTIAAPTHVYTTAGTYAVKVWVNDSAGGSQVLPLTVTVVASNSGGGGGGNNGGNSSGSSSPLSGSTLWILIALLVVVVVVVAVVMMMRGRKGGGSSTPPSGATSGSPPSNEPPAGASGAPPAGGSPPA